MTPIRVADLGVEPLDLSEMRGHLRLGPDDTHEDALLARLVSAARAAVESEARRILRPARFRLMLTAWPAGGVLPLPLSPLVSVAEAGLVDGEGAVTEIEPGLIRVGPDPWDAPCLLIGPGAPALGGQAALMEVSAGCGGDGPPIPEPLIQALRLTVADWFENRGDGFRDGPPRALPLAAAGLAAACRRMRL